MTTPTLAAAARALLDDEDAKRRGFVGMHPGKAHLWRESKYLTDLRAALAALDAQPPALAQPEGRGGSGECPNPGRGPCPSNCEHLSPPRCTLNDTTPPSQGTAPHADPEEILP